MSVNYQYIVGDVDWSPDGTRLAYIMATLPSLRGGHAARHEDHDELRV